MLFATVFNVTAFPVMFTTPYGAAWLAAFFVLFPVTLGMIILSEEENGW